MIDRDTGGPGGVFFAAIFAYFVIHAAIATVVFLAPASLVYRKLRGHWPSLGWWWVNVWPIADGYPKAAWWCRPLSELGFAATAVIAITGAVLTYHVLT